MSFGVTGGLPLYGSVSLQGAKNAALPILFATLLCREPVTLYHLPPIGDVAVAIQLLKDLGATVERVGEATVIDTRHATAPTLALKGAKKIRASAYLLGASLAAFGEGRIPLPGGCDLGERPLDLHERAFLSFGATVERGDGYLGVYGKSLSYATLRFPFPSVGATVNFILAALGAEGESRLYGYASEPHVLDLIGFLRKMGACIQTEGECLAVRGGPLHGGAYTVISDAMEGGTYLLAAAMAGGELTVSSLLPGELSAVTLVLSSMGFDIKEKEGSIRIRSDGASHYRGASIIAAPYPAFPTDLHPPFAALLCGVSGEGSVTDTVWRDRFLYVEELKKMGANVTRTGNRLTTYGTSLHGAVLRAPDLRGGAALLVAALAARGESVIHNTAVVKRGYADIVGKLRALGAHIAEE